MKIFLSFLLAGLLCSGLFSQTVNDVPLSEIDVEYVQIVGTGKFLSTKVTIELDFGQKTSFFGKYKQTQIKDEEIKGV